MRILKEPLFHFFLIGAAIFIWFHVISPDRAVISDPETIVISESDATFLAAQFETRWKRQPSDSELQALVDASIREEVLVREARKLGLDRGDSVIRSRLSQKMDFLTEAMATSVVPEDEDLEVFLQQNENRYATPKKVAFNQVFLGEDPSEAELKQTLNALRAKQVAPGLKSAILLPASMPLTATRVVDSVFGNGFSEGLVNLEEGRWMGPIQSGYGVHLVQVLATEPSRIPPLSAIHDQVLQDWRRAMRDDLSKAQYKALAESYEIIAPDFAGLAE